MRARVLVVGGAGFLGSGLVRALAAEDRVRVLDDFSTGRPDNLDGVGDVELIVGSILDREAIRSAFHGIEVVFHLACRGVRHSLHSPRENHRVNAEGTLLLLEEARRARVRRFVYTSTSEVYGKAFRVPMDEDHPTFPHTVYGASKLAGEAYVRASCLTHGFPTVIVRPFNSFGPRSHHEGDSGEVIPRFLTWAMNRCPLVVFGDGLQTRDFTYVDDTVGGIVRAARTDAAIGRTINLGTGTEVSINEVGAAVLRTVGHKVPIVHTPSRPGDVGRLVASRNLARELLGWTPRVSLEVGLRRLLAWHDQIGTDWGVALEEMDERNWQAQATP